MKNFAKEYVNKTKQLFNWFSENSHRSKLYNKSTPDVWDTIRRMPYDYTSVTHVGPFEHAINSNKPTVSAKYPGVYFGDHMNLSVIDVLKLRTLYGCQQGTCEQLVSLHKIV